jgi:hypothetical protein
MPMYFSHETNRGCELKYKQLVASCICCFPDLFLESVVKVFREHKSIFSELILKMCVRVGVIKIP